MQSPWAAGFLLFFSFVPLTASEYSANSSTNTWTPSNPSQPTEITLRFNRGPTPDNPGNAVSSKVCKRLNVSMEPNLAGLPSYSQLFLVDRSMKGDTERKARELVASVACLFRSAAGSGEGRVSFGIVETDTSGRSATIQHPVPLIEIIAKLAAEKAATSRGRRASSGRPSPLSPAERMAALAEAVGRSGLARKGQPLRLLAPVDNLDKSIEDLMTGAEFDPPFHFNKYLAEEFGLPAHLFFLDYIQLGIDLKKSGLILPTGPVAYISDFSNRTEFDTSITRLLGSLASNQSFWTNSDVVEQLGTARKNAELSSSSPEANSAQAGSVASSRFSSVKLRALHAKNHAPLNREYTGRTSEETTSSDSPSVSTADFSSTDSPILLVEWLGPHWLWYLLSLCLALFLLVVCSLLLCIFCCHEAERNRVEKVVDVSGVALPPPPPARRAGYKNLVLENPSRPAPLESEFLDKTQESEKEALLKKAPEPMENRFEVPDPFSPVDLGATAEAEQAVDRGEYIRLTPSDLSTISKSDVRPMKSNEMGTGSLAPIAVPSLSVASIVSFPSDRSSHK